VSPDLWPVPIREPGIAVFTLVRFGLYYPGPGISIVLEVDAVLGLNFIETLAAFLPIISS
jgi:hypothetical protein